MTLHQGHKQYSTAAVSQQPSQAGHVVHTEKRVNTRVVATPLRLARGCRPPTGSWIAGSHVPKCGEPHHENAILLVICLIQINQSLSPLNSVTEFLCLQLPQSGPKEQVSCGTWESSSPSIHYRSLQVLRPRCFWLTQRIDSSCGPKNVTVPAVPWSLAGLAKCQHRQDSPEPWS